LKARIVRRESARKGYGPWDNRTCPKAVTRHYFLYGLDK